MAVNRKANRNGRRERVRAEPPDTGPQKRFDLIGCGINVVDIVLMMPDRVRRNDKHPVRRLVVQGGGAAGNATAVAAALGLRTAFIAKQGDNMLSRIAEAEFKRCRIALNLFIPEPGARPAVSVVEVDPRIGDRTIFYNLDGYAPVRARDIPIAAVQSARLVLTDSYEREGALALLRAAANALVPSVVDIEAGSKDEMLKMLRLGTHCILPIDSARSLTGRQSPECVLHELARMAPNQMVITDGARGSWALAPDGVRHQPAFSVAVLDTTGCGDAYHGAYAAALLFGFGLPLRIEFAAWIAAQVAGQLGGRSELPTLAALRASDLSPLSAGLRAVLKSLP